MCLGTKFKKVIDFGKNPLVNSLIEKEDLNKKEKTFPLVVEQCQNCDLVQIVNPIDSHQIYQEQDYLYFTGDMPTTEPYFREFARDVEKRFLKREDFIVEIGSNDGTWLNYFANTDPNYRILGIDPATNVVLRALKRHIPTIPQFFSEKLAKKIAFEWGKAKIIMGANCIAHLNDLHDLMGGVKALLADNGVFIVECNYWGGMVENKNYALIYHDHFSYFSLKNWMDFLKKFDMEVFDAWVTPAQGGSLRLFSSIKGKRKPTFRFLKLFKEEIDSNLEGYETCQKYEKECREEARKLGDLIREFKSDESVIAGYGAAAKGFSVLKLAGIDQKQIDYFVDDSPAKQGKYTPVSHIPVISREKANNNLPDYFFITAPNYASVIIEKEKAFLQKGGKFILTDSSIIGG